MGTNRVNIGGIIYYDITVGDGFATSVYFSGCPLHCKGCHNKELWDTETGIPLCDEFIEEKVIPSLTVADTDIHLAILGGEPLSEHNIDGVVYLISYCRKVKPDLKVVVYTGYEIDELQNRQDVIEKICPIVDTLVVGRYKEEERDTTIPFVGSRNQRILTQSEFKNFFELAEK